MRRLVLAVAAILTALLLQVDVVNRLRLPGGHPDLVLLVVVSLALVGGPAYGGVAGFAAGFAADIVPPADHTIGRLAFVYALVGYGAGLLEDAEERSVLAAVAAVALGSVASVLIFAVDRIALLRQKGCGSSKTKCDVLDRLAELLKVPYQELSDKITLCGPSAPAGCWNGSPYEPIPVSELKNDTASTRLALQILDRQEDFPGVSAKPAAVRTYLTPSGALASHVLGYLGPISPEELKKLPKAEQDSRRSDYVGRSGLESQYDEFLRGEPGITQVAVDHLGAVTSTLKETAPQAGDNLVTSLNADVQAALEKALAGAVKSARAIALQGGGDTAVVAAGAVLDAATRTVVALASYQ